MPNDIYNFQLDSMSENKKAASHIFPYWQSGAETWALFFTLFIPYF